MFDDPDNMAKWQPTFSLNITERREPVFVAGTYESGKGTAIIVNHFEELPDGTTKWAAYSNHTFKGLYRFLALFMHKSISNQVENDLNRFKLFVESEIRSH